MPKAQDPEIDIEFEIEKQLAIYRARRNPTILRWLEFAGPDPPESPTKPRRKRPRDAVSDDGDPDDNPRISSPNHSPVARVMSSDKRKKKGKAQKTQPDKDGSLDETDTRSNVTDGVFNLTPASERLNAWDYKLIFMS